jgi:predicted nucleotidyltransferase component of viral defense system
MKKEIPKNLAASVRQRLMNQSRARGENFQAILIRYALERLLYRLSQSGEGERFLLKGALLFLLWSNNPHRSTRDIDLLGSGNPDVETLSTLFVLLCSLPVGEDGLVFLADSVKAMPIRKDDIYGGVRVSLLATLENAQIPVQIDIGFGDSITPPPENVAFPVLLDFPAPQMRAYPKETMIAEKLHALVVLETSNSRMKDFFDLYVLARQFPFEGERLRSAIESTFVRRGTLISAEKPVGLTPAFSEDNIKKAQWSAFVKRQKLTEQELPLDTVIAGISEFLLPVMEAIRESKLWEARWEAGGPWIAP